MKIPRWKEAIPYKPFILKFILMRSIKIALIALVLVLAQVTVHHNFTHVEVIAFKDDYGLSSSSPRIKIIGAVWDKTNLRVLIVSTSWLDKKRLDSVIKVFSIWDRALESFGNSYGYEYLLDFSFKVKVSSVYETGYDIVVKFSRDVVEPGGEIGLARIEYYDGKIVKASITLYTRTTAGDLSAIDIFNVALHEVGHALGLGHAESKYTEHGLELMYPVYSYPDMELRPSTLDVYALARIYSWLETGVFKPPDKTVITLPSHIPYRMLLYYRVTVYSKYGTVIGGGWYLEGSLVNVTLLSTTVALGEGVRAVFKKWTGYVNSDKPGISFRIYQNVELHAEWKIQYYLNITTPLSRVNVSSGWYDEGTMLTISLQNTTVYIGSDTRYVFSKWKGDIESENSTLVIVVNKPLSLTAEWRLEYRVEIFSQYSNPLNATGWYPEGVKVFVGVLDEIVDLGNKTRVVLKGWIGTFNIESTTAQIIVTQPFQLEAVWIREYLVEVSSEYTESFKKWVPARQFFKLKLNTTIVLEDNGTRRVFAYWIVKDRIVENSVLEVKIEEPLFIKAVWKTQYEVILNARDMEDNPLDAVFFISGEEVKSGQKVWLDRGKLKIAGVFYNRTVRAPIFVRYLTGWNEFSKLTECKPLEEKITIDSPGIYDVKLRVWKVKIKAVDLLTMPSPLYMIKIGDEKYLADLDGLLLETELPEGVHEVEVYFLGFKIGKENILINKPGVYYLKTPATPYYIALLAIATTYLAKRRKTSPAVVQENSNT
ncbi:MAG: hypothetical protein DRJ37_01890 [Thermoprotei archaeon]|nr:MAG: hypothetical protein DRJ37_01890 [Thermoprotei archaeon]